MTVPSLAGALAPLVADPSGTVLLFDFDGTLAPIVASPAAARPAPGVVDLLDRLAERYRLVGTVSGRPVEFLAAHLPRSLVLSGLYGLESVVHGVHRVRPGVEQWRAPIRDVADRAEAAGVEGLLVERKGLSVTLHFRSRPRAGAAVTRLAAELAELSGLEARPAKMSAELHPPVRSDKGLVVHELADGARGVVYVGDDVGDLPAFAALAELRAVGVTTVGVAVETPELPDAVRVAADLQVDGPVGVVGLLRVLLG